MGLGSRRFGRVGRGMVGAPLPGPPPQTAWGKGERAEMSGSAVEFSPLPCSLGGRGRERGGALRTQCDAVRRRLDPRLYTPLSARNERGGAGGGAGGGAPRGRQFDASRRAPVPSASPTSPRLFWGRWARFTSPVGAPADAVPTVRSAPALSYFRTFALSHFRTAVLVNRKNVEDIYPLSPLQQGMLFHALYSPETGAYVEQWPLLVDGRAGRGRPTRAFQRAVDRHPVLRTGLVWENVPQPLQVVFREAEVAVRAAGLVRRGGGGVAGAAGRRSWRRTARAASTWRAAPLLRLTYARLDGAAAPVDLHLSPRHPGRLVRAAGVRGRGCVLPRRARGAHAAPAARAQVPRLRGVAAAAGSRARTRRSGARTLAGFTEATPLPLDRGGAAVAEEHATCASACSADEHRAAERLRAGERGHAQHAGAGRVGADARALVAASATWCSASRWRGGRRRLPGVERTVGLFINTIPFRVRVPEGGTVGEWLAAVQHAQAEMRQHEHVSLVDVQGWSAVPRDRPLFESAYVFENLPLSAPGTRRTTGAVHVTAMEVPERVNYALTLVGGAGGRAGAAAELRSAPLHARTPRARIMAALRTALDALSRSAARPLSARRRAGGGGAARRWRRWAAASRWTRSPPSAACSRRRRRARRTRPRWSSRGATVTYAELEARANRAGAAPPRARRGAGPRWSPCRWSARWSCRSPFWR